MSLLKRTRSSAFKKTLEKVVEEHSEKIAKEYNPPTTTTTTTTTVPVPEPVPVPNPEEEKQLLEKAKKLAEIVVLDVGGQKFKTTIGTLTTAAPYSLLALIFSPTNASMLKPQADGSYFIDRDGTHFQRILNALRNQDLSLLDYGEDDTEWKKELDFYGISVPGEESSCDTEEERMKKEPRRKLSDEIKKMNSMLGTLVANAIAGTWRYKEQTLSFMPRKKCVIVVTVLDGDLSIVYKQPHNEFPAQTIDVATLLAGIDSDARNGSISAKEVSDRFCLAMANALGAISVFIDNKCHCSPHSKKRLERFFEVAGLLNNDKRTDVSNVRRRIVEVHIKFE